MRIWDLPVENLCDKHLLGEHRELHAIWSIITQNKKGYSKHPETMRWKGRIKRLAERHREQVEEMDARGFKHYSFLECDSMALYENSYPMAEDQDIFVHTIEEQKQILKSKKCNCKI